MEDLVILLVLVKMIYVLYAYTSSEWNSYLCLKNQYSNSAEGF